MKSRVVSMCIVPVKERYFHSGKEIQTYVMLNCGNERNFINTDLARKTES